MNINHKLVENKIIEILNIYTSGIKEYDLLKILQKEKLFPEYKFNDNLSMFKIHFLLFNILYNLRDNLLSSEVGILNIFTLSIVLLPYEKREEHITLYDPLAEYYKNINNLETTTESDVIKLLDNFWTKYCASEQKETALKILGLDNDVDFFEIKKRYRSLVSIHHPDKGGCSDKFQLIQESMEILERWYLS